MHTFSRGVFFPEKTRNPPHPESCHQKYVRHARNPAIKSPPCPESPHDYVICNAALLLNTLVFIGGYALFRARFAVIPLRISFINVLKHPKNTYHWCFWGVFLHLGFCRFSRVAKKHEKHLFKTQKRGFRKKASFFVKVKCLQNRVLGNNSVTGLRHKKSPQKGGHPPEKPTYKKTRVFWTTPNLKTKIEQKSEKSDDKKNRKSEKKWKTGWDLWNFWRKNWKKRSQKVITFRGVFGGCFWGCFWTKSHFHRFGQKVPLSRLLFGRFSENGKSDIWGVLAVWEHGKKQVQKQRKKDQNRAKKWSKKGPKHVPAICRFLSLLGDFWRDPKTQILGVFSISVRKHAYIFTWEIYIWLFITYHIATHIKSTYVKKHCIYKYPSL